MCGAPTANRADLDTCRDREHTLQHQTLDSHGWHGVSCQGGMQWQVDTWPD